jgi:mono/diheme cytochrome c family protein
MSGWAQTNRQRGKAMRRNRIVALIGAAALLGGCVQESQQVGRANFEAYCAGCHGDNARGNGPLAGDLEVAPPDLTLIALRNGGDFPMTRVMSVIDGYTRADQHGSTMPEFGALLEGPTVMVEYEGGVMTPTPATLVALANYLESVQR